MNPLRLIALLALASSLAFAGAPRVVELWPEGVPGLRPDASPEKLVDGRITNILSGCAATLWDHPHGKTGAAMDSVSARPDFAVLIYPVVTLSQDFTHRGSREALLGKSPAQEIQETFSLEKSVRKDSPPFFIVATMADTVVPVMNSLSLYQELVKAGVPSEMHVYAKGSHSNSTDPQYGPTAAWPLRLNEWLKFNGWLDAPRK